MLNYTICTGLVWKATEVFDRYPTLYIIQGLPQIDGNSPPLSVSGGEFLVRIGAI